MLRSPNRVVTGLDDTPEPQRSAFVGPAAAAPAALAAGFAVVAAVGGPPRHPVGGSPDVVVADAAALPDDPAGWADLLPRPPDATGHLREVATRLRTGAVFLDFDGTLSPIVAEPSAARPAPGAVDAIGRLAGLVPVGIVSGRGLADVRKRVGIDGVAYAGSHGFEVVDFDGHATDHPDGVAALPRLDAAEAALRDATGDLGGIEVERKRYAVAVHTRRAVDDATRRRAAAVAAAAVVPGLRLTVGKEVLELRPDVGWHKGTVVESLTDGRLPMYLGDDTTDEDALAAVRRHGGIGIKVGPPGHPAETWASMTLPDPPAVVRFLDALADELG
jgi:trehalose 6-phosphate phosphatase